MSPLVRKLSAFNELAAGDIEALDELSRSPVSFKAGRHLIREGARPEEVFLLQEGWAQRYHTTSDGGRQIVAFLVPGDLCDPQAFILEQMDHSIGLLGDASVVVIPKKLILEITDRHPAVARAFWWSALVDEAVLRQWLVNLGRRDAFERLAHLICELWQRLSHVGLTSGGEFTVPLTQEQLGDALGLTAVHVNRTLQRMRAAGLVSSRGRQLVIHDVVQLKKIAGFDPNYLHMSRTR